MAKNSSNDAARAGRDAIARPKGIHKDDPVGPMSGGADALEAQVRDTVTVGGEKLGHCR